MATDPFVQGGIGLVVGVVWGLYGFWSNRQYDPQVGWEQFDVVKLGRTVVVYGAAGAIVGYSGDQLTQGNVAAATAYTMVLGEAAERVIKRVQKQLAA